MNTINVIKPYKWHGIWVFDDPAKEINKEPFVAGADAVLDYLSATLNSNSESFLLLFSDTQFPGHTHKAIWQREDEGGNWYQLAAMQGWLCPALLKYFDDAPSVIYLQCKQEPEVCSS